MFNGSGAQLGQQNCAQHNHASLFCHISYAALVGLCQSSSVILTLIQHSTGSRPPHSSPDNSPL